MEHIRGVDCVLPLPDRTDRARRNFIGVALQLVERHRLQSFAKRHCAAHQGTHSCGRPGCSRPTSVVKTGMPTLHLKLQLVRNKSTRLQLSLFSAVQAEVCEGGPVTHAGASAGVLPSPSRSEIGGPITQFFSRLHCALSAAYTPSPIPGDLYHRHCQLLSCGLSSESPFGGFAECPTSPSSRRLRSPIAQLQAYSWQRTPLTEMRVRKSSYCLVATEDTLVYCLFCSDERRSRGARFSDARALLVHWPTAPAGSSCGRGGRVRGSQLKFRWLECIRAHGRPRDTPGRIPPSSSRSP